MIILHIIKKLINEYIELIPLEVHTKILNYLDTNMILDYIDISRFTRVIFLISIKSLSGDNKRLIMYEAAKYNNHKLLDILVNNDFPIISDSLCKLSASINALSIITENRNCMFSKR